MKSNEAKKKQKYLGNCVRRQRWNHKTNNYVFCTGASNGIKKTPKFKADFVDETEKSKPKKSFKTTIRKESVVRFYGKSAANLKSISKVSRIIPNIRYEKHLSGTATVWMVFNWKRIYRYQKFKQKTPNKKRTDSIPF